MDDLTCMCLMASLSEPKFGPTRNKSSWAADVDERMNNRSIKGGKSPSSIAVTCGSLREVEGGLSDSDLAVRWNLATCEARKALKLGKKLGMHIEGDEQEAWAVVIFNCPNIVMDSEARVIEGNADGGKFSDSQFNPRVGCLKGSYLHIRDKFLLDGAPIKTSHHASRGSCFVTWIKLVHVEASRVVGFFNYVGWFLGSVDGNEIGSVLHCVVHWQFVS
ncbi:hypothetical protein V6N13_038412 [Hibiscus sabdariffa]